MWSHGYLVMGKGWFHWCKKSNTRVICYVIQVCRITCHPQQSPSIKYWKWHSCRNRCWNHIGIYLSIYLSIDLSRHCTEALHKVNGLYYRKSSIWISSTSSTPSNANNWERKSSCNTQQKLWRFQQTSSFEQNHCAGWVQEWKCKLSSNVRIIWAYCPNGWMGMSKYP